MVTQIIDGGFLNFYFLKIFLLFVAAPSSNKWSSS